MKKMINKTFSLFVIAALLFATASTGCKKEEQETAPELPPKSSFVMDFSDFTGDNAKHIKSDETYQNFTLAVIHVAVWNTIITVHMAIPVASFVESFNHKPELQSDGSWKWSYTISVGANTFEANLIGKVVDTNVEWNMYVSKTGTGAYTDFNWYSGTSNLDGTQGTWTLNLSPQNPIPFIGIEWHKNNDGTSGITYTNIIPEAEENGGYISYGVTTSTPYDAYYEIYNKVNENLVEINWSKTTGAGRIKDPLHFGNTNFHCWNENRIDIDCP